MAFDVSDEEENGKNREGEEEVKMGETIRGLGKMPVFIRGRRNRQQRPGEKGDEQNLVDWTANSSPPKQGKSDPPGEDFDILPHEKAAALDRTTCSVGRSVGRSRLAFFGVYGRFWGYCSCPTAWLVNFITAPAHPHATRVAVYPPLFFQNQSISNQTEKSIE